MKGDTFTKISYIQVTSDEGVLQRALDELYVLTKRFISVSKENQILSKQRIKLLQETGPSKLYIVRENKITDQVLNSNFFGYEIYQGKYMSIIKQNYCQSYIFGTLKEIIRNKATYDTQ